MRSKRYSFNLASHLAICDANYERLLALMPDLRSGVSSTLVLQFKNSLDGLTMKSCSSGPYTSVVEMSHRSVSFLPRLRLSIHTYHDFRIAEVKRFQGDRDLRAFYPYPNPTMKLPDEKIQVNRFCAELLDFCLISMRITKASCRRSSIVRC